jgi:hypothetical protein
MKILISYHSEVKVFAKHANIWNKINFVDNIISENKANPDNIKRLSKVRNYINKRR